MLVLVVLAKHQIEKERERDGDRSVWMDEGQVHWSSRLCVFMMSASERPISSRVSCRWRIGSCLEHEFEWRII